MEFEKIPTIPTAEEILDRSFRRAAVKMKEKRNKDRANVDFVRTVHQAVHDRLIKVIRSFPEFDTVPLFYYEITDILFSIDRIRKSLGAVGWAAKWAREHGPGLSYQARKADDPTVIRKRAVARLASVVHQVGPDLLFLNEVRNVLRKLPHVGEHFTVVVAGFPNVGKSSFIRRVSSAEPEVASYPFTTKGIIVGHRETPQGRVQFIDTPGILERPPEKRNPVEKQAVSAMLHVADAILFIVDPSAHCGYPLDDQLRLLKEIEGMVDVPLVVVTNKSDIMVLDNYPAMATVSGDGVEEVLLKVLSYHVPGLEKQKGVSDQKTEDRPPV